MELEKRTAIITYIDSNYELNLVNDFLFSLRNVANYQGKVIVIDYGISESVYGEIVKKYQCEVISYKKEYPVFSLRNKHIPFIIERLPSNISNVMVIDGGDIWFQKSIIDIFLNTKDKIGYVEEPIIFGSNEWTDNCLAILDEKMKTMIYKQVKNRNVKNSGMICGPCQLVIELLQNVYIDMQNSGKEYFGIDQLFLNYEICKNFCERSILLPEEYNYVLITHRDEYIYTSGQVFDRKGKLVTIVHNAGGKWRLIKRQYSDLLDEEQYSLKRVNLLKKD